MTTTGGYQPGTFQAADLNRLQAVFGSAGIARGMQVTQTSPLGLSVLVSVDAVKGDGVCYLPNGGWVRLDAALTLTVPSNGTGGTRNDAVVATMDPTGVLGNASVQYIINWAGGFAGGTTNQLVLALVAVPNGAATIVSGNITQSTAAATFGSSNTSGNLLPGGQIQTTAISTFIVHNINSSGNIEVDVTTQLGTTRGYVIAPVDASGITHRAATFNPDGSTTFPSVQLFANGTGTVPTMTTSSNVKLYLASTTAGITFNKYDLFLLLPFS